MSFKVILFKALPSSPLAAGLMGFHSVTGQAAAQPQNSKDPVSDVQHITLSFSL